MTGKDSPRIMDATSGLAALIDALRRRSYTVVGPTLRDEAIVLDVLESVDDLPAGWTDEQAGGHYRLTRRADEAYFGFAVGPQSAKQFLHAPNQELWHAEKVGDEVRITAVETESASYAFIGLRSCDIHAIAVQDRVLIDDRYQDPHYRARRRNNIVIAVNCGHAGETCFCASMHTGPRAEQGYDLALTEFVDADCHRLLVEIGSERGADLVEELPVSVASAGDRDRADRIVAKTANQMGRKMDTAGIRDLLMDNLEHPRWDDVAERCLSCGNCTQACPTCFCTTSVETSDLTGDRASHARHWDSCFTLDFSYLHGGSVRRSTKARYRQWMTHKLATWIDQFGSSGCVGCGRCITWCPVGIDITEEVGAIRQESPET